MKTTDEIKLINHINSLKDELFDAHQKLEKLKSIKNNTTILIAGLYFAKVNLGTDVENPNGKFYTFNQAQELCPDGWEVPSKEDFRQLLNNTTQLATIRDGMEGLLFTDEVTKTEMFLPFSGYRYYNDSSLYNQDTYGHYWSSSVLDSNFGWHLSLYSGGYTYSDGADIRGNSLSVRCIKKCN